MAAEIRYPEEIKEAARQRRLEQLKQKTRKAHRLMGQAASSTRIKSKNTGW